MAAMGILFFVYSYLLIGNYPPRFSWPDEMATYFFLNHFADTGTFAYYEPLNELAYNLITPRSVTIVDGSLVPVGFIGLPLLYGFASIPLGDLVLFLTPLLGVLSVYLVYRCTRMFFDEKVAVVSSVLMALQPSWAYYASFALLPNVPFQFFILAALFFFLRNFYERSIFYNYIFSGLFLGIALMIRPSELVWVAVLFVILVIAYWRDIPLLSYVYFVLPASLCGLVLLYFNFITYGSYFGGYTNQVSQSGDIGEAAVFPLLNFFMPFGFDMQILWGNLSIFFFANWHYLLLFIFGIVSMVVFYKGKEKRGMFVVVGCTSVLLLLYYGSWELVDTFTLSHSMLGVSFNRYWLWIIVALIPCAAYFLVHLASLSRGYKVFSYSIIGVCLLLNVHALYARGHDNLRNIRTSLYEGAYLHELVMRLTEEDAVIITQRGDKFVFPERAVISQFNPADLTGITRLVHEHPVYYVIYEDTVYIDQLNEIFFNKQGLQIERLYTLEYGYLVYEVTTL
jgi:hypothetical protein